MTVGGALGLGCGVDHLMSDEDIRHDMSVGVVAGNVSAPQLKPDMLHRLSLST